MFDNILNKNVSVFVFNYIFFSVRILRQRWSSIHRSPRGGVRVCVRARTHVRVGISWRKILLSRGGPTLPPVSERIPAANDGGSSGSSREVRPIQWLRPWPGSGSINKSGWFVWQTIVQLFVSKVVRPIIDDLIWSILDWWDKVSETSSRLQRRLSNNWIMM